jgi:hypothetical protein
MASSLRARSFRMNGEAGMIAANVSDSMTRRGPHGDGSRRVKVGSRSRAKMIRPDPALEPVADKPGDETPGPITLAPARDVRSILQIRHQRSRVPSEHLRGER